MKSVVKMLAAVGLCAAAAIPALADPGTKVALVPGGPHPYFAAWEQAGMDAMKDLGGNPDDIGNMFKGFQRHLYLKTA